MSPFLFVKESSHRVLLSAMQGNGRVMPNRRDLQIKPDRIRRNKHPLEGNNAPKPVFLHRRHTDKRSTNNHLEPFQGMRGGNDIFAQQVLQEFARDHAVGRMVNFDLGSKPAQPILLPLAG